VNFSLPSTLTSFVGRGAELEQLRALFDAKARLVTLFGPGGIGKTRLALATPSYTEAMPFAFVTLHDLRRSALLMMARQSGIFGGHIQIEVEGGAIRPIGP
jgi:hypothetical protein